MSANDQSEMARLRLDKWLWAARFYKTRSLASGEIQKGRVQVNGQRAKPSRVLVVGDTVTVVKTPYEFVVTVQKLSEKRGPAVQARELYAETAASEAKRTELGKTQSAERAIMHGLQGEGRPSKRQRRQIIQFRSTRDSSED